ncbi:MAG: ArnT family glycosyltransferase [Chloroflexota bacterium]
MRTPLLLYALALGVRILLAALYPDPAYPDSYYYVDVARALHATGRLEVDFVWIFGEVGGHIPAIPTLPVPSNAHWLPLSSFLQLPFIALLGPTAWASALPMALIGALSAPLTWLIAREAGARREVQIGASILAAIPAAGAVFMPQPENFAILQPLVAATIWLTARGLKGHAGSYALAGLLVGLASLARNDGFILGLGVAIAFFWDRAQSLRSRGIRPPRIPVAAVVGCVALYLVVMGPWFLRQLAVFGSISPTTSTGSALWIREYREWNSITANPSLQAFLAQGIGPIVSSRMFGLVAAIGQFVVIICSVVLLPFLVVGGWLRRRSIDFGPWFLFTLLVFLGATLLYPLHVPGGAFIHSAVGLEPHGYILALEGVAAAVAWIARRRPRWNESTATPVFVGAIVALTIATAALYALPVHAAWSDSAQPRIALASQLDRLGVAADDRLLSIDAAGMKYFTGRGGVVTPDDPIDTIESVARAYDTRWLVLERDQAAQSLGPVLRGDERPSWIGPAVYSVPSTDGGPPRLALYPVCVQAGDARCGTTAAAGTP